jgi:pimeloyl-ACP methyl ester carboxylesterase
VIDCLASTGWEIAPPIALAVILLAFGATVIVALRRGGRMRGGAALGLVAVLVLGATVMGSAASGTPAYAADPSCPSAMSTTAPTTSTPAVLEPITGDQPISFTSGGVTFYGDYRGPVDTTAAVPAVAIVVGTGGIDRDGNAPTLQTEDYSWLADLFASVGIASVRYDKLGTGQTGLGPFAANPASMLPLSYEQLRVQPARDALSFIAAQPGVDASRLLLLGHSEGGAVAVEIATHPGSEPPLAGLLLIEPAYAHILDTLVQEFSSQMDGAVAGGAMTAVDSDTLKAWMQAGVSEIRDGTPPYPVPGPVPLPDAQEYTQVIQAAIQTNIYGDDPAEMVVSHAYRTAYGKQFDTIVPYELVSQIAVPTLITCGTKDFNVPCGDGSPGSGVVNMAANFAPGVAQFEVIPNMVHILRDVGDADVPNIADQVNYPFSDVLRARISAFASQFTTPKTGTR